MKITADQIEAFDEFRWQLLELLAFGRKLHHKWKFSDDEDEEFFFARFIVHSRTIICAFAAVDWDFFTDDLSKPLIDRFSVKLGASLNKTLDWVWAAGYEQGNPQDVFLAAIPVNVDELFLDLEWYHNEVEDLWRSLLTFEADPNFRYISDGNTARKPTESERLGTIKEVANAIGMSEGTVKRYRDLLAIKPTVETGPKNRRKKLYQLDTFIHRIETELWGKGQK